MLRRDALEDGDNHERWLISYADFITLLFGFFVVMYAISSVNEGKYRVLSTTLTAAFDAAPKSLDPIQVGEPLLAASPHLIDIPDETGYRDEQDGDTHLPLSVDHAEAELLEQLNSLYPGYLPVTLAYAKALNTYRQPDKSIELLLRQLQSDQYAEIYRLLAQAYHLNGQTSAALEATGNQYAMQGYYELAMQQYGIALNHEDLSKTSKTRLETKKKELMEIVKQRNY